MPNFIGKVFAVLRRRPNFNSEENSRFEGTSGLIAHDHADPSLAPRPLPTPALSSTSTRATPTNAQSGFSPGRESEADDSGAFADVLQRVSFFSGSNGATMNGGEIYVAAGNLTVQRTEPSNSNEAVVRALENYAETNDRRMERLEQMMTVMIQTQYRSHLPPTISVGFVYVMDATGRKHPITMNMARSLDQFHDALRVLFDPGTAEDIVLCKYMDIDAYTLNFHDGKEVIQLMNQDTWSSVVQDGMTLVMTVVMGQYTEPAKYKCPFCDIWNELKGLLGRSSIDCHSCYRRFKITSSGEMIGGVQTTPFSHQEQNRIHNIHQEKELGTVVNPSAWFFKRASAFAIKSGEFTAIAGNYHGKPPSPASIWPVRGVDFIPPRGRGESSVRARQNPPQGPPPTPLCQPSGALPPGSASFTESL